MDSNIGWTVMSDLREILVLFSYTVRHCRNFLTLKIPSFVLREPLDPSFK